MDGSTAQPDTDEKGDANSRASTDDEQTMLAALEEALNEAIRPTADDSANIDPSQGHTGSTLKYFCAN